MSTVTAATVAAPDSTYESVVSACRVRRRSAAEHEIQSLTKKHDDGGGEKGGMQDFPSLVASAPYSAVTSGISRTSSPQLPPTHKSPNVAQRTIISNDGTTVIANSATAAPIRTSTLSMILSPAPISVPVNFRSPSPSPTAPSPHSSHRYTARSNSVLPPTSPYARVTPGFDQWLTTNSSFSSAVARQHRSQHTPGGGAHNSSNHPTAFSPTKKFETKLMPPPLFSPDKRRTAALTAASTAAAAATASTSASSSASDSAASHHHDHDSLLVKHSSFTASRTSDTSNSIDSNSASSTAAIKRPAPPIPAKSAHTTALGASSSQQQAAASSQNPQSVAPVSVNGITISPLTVSTTNTAAAALARPHHAHHPTITVPSNSPPAASPASAPHASLAHKSAAAASSSNSSASPPIPTRPKSPSFLDQISGFFEKLTTPNSAAVTAGSPETLAGAEPMQHTEFAPRVPLQQQQQRSVEMQERKAEGKTTRRIKEEEEHEEKEMKGDANTIIATTSSSYSLTSTAVVSSSPPASATSSLIDSSSSTHHTSASSSSWYATPSELSFFDSLASYGFHHDDHRPEKQAWLVKYAKRLEEQEAAWNEVQKRVEVDQQQSSSGGTKSSSSHKNLTSKEYKFLTRSGIPASYRPRVWWCWLNPELIRSREIPQYYQKLSHSNFTDLLDTETLRNINKDIDRTFISHAMFRDPSGEGVASLKRVLCTYALRNSSIGYCQSLNFVAAFFLLFYEEEEAFFMLTVLLEEFLPPDYYTSTMIGMLADVNLLNLLIEKNLPKIWEHLKKLECTHLEGIFTSWFLTLFIKITPIETTLRIFDSLFVEGTKVLMRVALAIIEESEKEILACEDMGAIFQFFNTLGSQCYDCDALMKRAFEFQHIKRGWIEKERKKQVKLLQKQYQEMERKRKMSMEE